MRAPHAPTFVLGAAALSLWLALGAGCNRARVESIDLMNQGIEAESKEMHTKAVELLTKSTEVDPECLECRLALATVYEKEKDFSNAAEHYRRALALAANDAEVHYKLGATLQELSKFDEAKAELSKAIELNADHYRAYYKLGQVLKAMGDIDGAGPAFKKAAEINPYFSFAFIEYGILFFDLGWLEPKYYDDAVKVFSEGIRVNDNDATLHNLLASSLANKEPPEHDKAIPEFEKALKIDPTLHDASFGLGVSYHAIGEKAKAKEILTDWLKVSTETATEDQRQMANSIIYETPLVDPEMLKMKPK
ncbi:MAG TPA: tetratricopeptide repeat protein [Myxococcota bacterium]|jgi:tetratricopeptide (TPR) repeat protein|nr:tetratricopeptide repeat protein [Myxococcota bacterium]